MKMEGSLAMHVQLYLCLQSYVWSYLTFIESLCFELQHFCTYSLLLLLCNKSI